MEKLWMAQDMRKQYGSMLALWWAKCSPALHSVLTSLVYQYHSLKSVTGRTTQLQEKRDFLVAQEAWNHLVRVGITQTNKLWVGILILGKHLSLEGEKANAAAGWLILSFCPPPHCFITHQPSFLSSICFCSFGWFFFFLVPIWYGLVMCFHFLVNIYWVYNIPHPCQRSGMRVNLGDVFKHDVSSLVCLKMVTLRKGGKNWDEKATSNLGWFWMSLFCLSFICL